MINFFVVFLTWLCFSHVLSRPYDFITRDVQVELPGSEKINKRSPQDYIEISKATPVTDGDYVKGEYDDLSNEYFTENDSYGSRRKRSVLPDNELESMDSNDMEVAENGLVFLPLFRSKNNYELKQRLRRSVDNVKQTNDNLEAGNEMMLLPAIYPVNDLKDKTLDAVEASKVHQVPSRSRRSEDVDMDTAENGLIFRPLFRSRQQTI